MTETEVDEYKLNSTGRQQSLKISLINNQQIAMTLINKNTNQQYSSYLSLQSLQNLSQAFSNVKSIQEALSILKSTIESGNISLIEDTKDSSYSIVYEITTESGKYPEFEVNLNLEQSQADNSQQELPVTFDYQGNAEAEAKYGKSTKSTTETNTIVESQVKPPVVQLEYIEPILQVHYPDGTTKSKALPPRIQGPDGEKANISEEQFKQIQEQINRNTTSSFKKLSPIKDNLNINRSNSVTKSRSTYSTKTVQYNLNSNLTEKNPFGNVVRPAMQNSTNNNMNNINQVRSAFTINPNTNIVNNLNVQNQYKATSNYSTMTTPYNRTYAGYVAQTPNQNNFNNTGYLQKQYYNQFQTSRNVIEERRPRMTNINPNMQRNNNRSLSTPMNDNFNKFNQNNQMRYTNNITTYQTNQYQTANQYETANQGYQTNPVNQVNQANYGYQNNIITSNNYGQTQNYYNINLNNKPPQARQVYNKNVAPKPTIQTQGQGIYYSTPNPTNQNISGVYNQNPNQSQNQINAVRQIKPNNNNLAMQQSQELIQSHQKRIQEIQRQLALIQQQHQKLQEQQKQLILQQQLQRQIIQKQTMTNNPQSQVISTPQNKYQGFAQVSQFDRRFQSQEYGNPQIKQSQTLTNKQPFVHQTSQEIKQTKTTFAQNPNPPFKTQISTPMSLQTPKLQQYNNSSNNDDEISEQQIALAQMASMQNQENPEYENLKAITLQQKEEEVGEVQEEAATQYQQEQVQEQATQGEEQEEIDIEALFMTEEGKIIFRNGLLRGIIHKYAEIDDVISKIQDILLKGVKFTLVYKAFDAGDKAETFHEKCDKCKMSLVLIETDKDVRFGGFTTKSWEGNNIKKKDNNAFVFSLDTNSVFDIIKNEPAIGCYPKFGPVFFGCQIRIYDEFFTKGGTTCHKGLNYKTKKDYELNNGEQKYLIKDIEVYDIEAIDV